MCKSFFVFFCCFFSPSLFFFSLTPPLLHQHFIPILLWVDFCLRTYGHEMVHGLPLAAFGLTKQFIYLFILFYYFFPSSVSDGIPLLLKWCDSSVQTLAPQESLEFLRGAPPPSLRFVSKALEDLIFKINLWMMNLQLLPSRLGLWARRSLRAFVGSYAQSLKEYMWAEEVTKYQYFAAVFR